MTIRDAAAVRNVSFERSCLVAWYWAEAIVSDRATRWVKSIEEEAATVWCSPLVTEKPEEARKASRLHHLISAALAKSVKAYENVPEGGDGLIAAAEAYMAWRMLDAAKLWTRSAAETALKEANWGGTDRPAAHLEAVELVRWVLGKLHFRPAGSVEDLPADAKGEEADAWIEEVRRSMPEGDEEYVAKRARLLMRDMRAELTENHERAECAAIMRAEAQRVARDRCADWSLPVPRKLIRDALHLSREAIDKAIKSESFAKDGRYVKVRLDRLGNGDRVALVKAIEKSLKGGTGAVRFERRK